MRLKIYGTGSALPAKKVSNDLLSEYMDTSDEWIRSRTGIVNRRLAMEETTSSLAVEAGRKALEDAKAAPEEVEIVIVATFTPDCSLPSTACIVQDQLYQSDFDKILLEADSHTKELPEAKDGGE